MSDVLEKPDTETISLTDHQLYLEKLFSKNQLIPRIKAEFNDPKQGFIPHLEEQGIPVAFGLDVLVQMSIHKRASLPTMVGLLYHHFDDGQATADMLVKAAEADLMDWSPELKVFVVRFILSADVQEEIDRFMFPLPMVIPPREIRNNRTSGYLLNQGSVILRKNHHEDDICLDHLNRANSVPMSVNMDTVRMVKNQWRNLDKPKVGETHEEFEQRRRAFEKFDRVAHDVIATVIECGNRFYFTHRVDKRGRTYSHGYYLNPQGNSWCKSILEFANKEFIP